MMKEQNDPCKIDPKSANQGDWIPLEIVASSAVPDVMLAVDTIASDPAVQQQIADYTKWNEWLVAGAGLIETMDAVLIKTIKNKTAQTAINAACHTFYDAAQGMNKDIVDAIKGLEKNPPEQPTVEFPPSTLPDWPDTSKPNLFSSIWDLTKPLLQMLDEKLVASHPDSPIVVALGGLISAGDNIVNTLSKYYPEWVPEQINGKK